MLFPLIQGACRSGGRASVRSYSSHGGIIMYFCGMEGHFGEFGMRRMVVDRRIHTRCGSEGQLVTLQKQRDSISRIVDTRRHGAIGRDDKGYNSVVMRWMQENRTPIAPTTPESQEKKYKVIDDGTQTGESKDVKNSDDLRYRYQGPFSQAVVKVKVRGDV